MQQLKFRKLFTIAVAVVLAFSLATSALAAWPSFQNKNVSNGVISDWTYPIIDPTLVTIDPLGITPIQLPTNNPTGYDVWTGVDATSVINNGVVYTIYNGGVYNSTTPNVGGARIQATKLSDGTTLWNKELFDSDPYQLDRHADNVMQLSTPYYHTATNTLYAVKNFVAYSYSSTDLSGWETDGVAEIDNGIATFPAGNSGTIYSPLFQFNHTYFSVTTLSIETNLNLGSSTTSMYSVTLVDEYGNDVAELVPSTNFTGSWGTIYTYNGTPIPVQNSPSGTPINALNYINYAVKITVSGGTDSTVGNMVKIGNYRFGIHKITNAHTASPNVTMMQNFDGQVNSPIGYGKAVMYGFSGDSIFITKWGGDGGYIEININTGMTAGGRNHNSYNAGVTTFTRNGTNYGVYGTDEGILCVIGGLTFDTESGHMIRSSIAIAADSTGKEYAYFTSYNGTEGKLWKIPVDDFATHYQLNYQDYMDAVVRMKTSYIELPGASTSTPVISENGYIYVGWHKYDYLNFTSIGGVVGVSVDDFFENDALFDVYGNGITLSNPVGDPVQSSPIVFSDTTEDAEVDYIYFTTNSYAGAGYCYYNDIGQGSGADILWTAGGGTTNPYAVQGFAAGEITKKIDNKDVVIPYLVYGDDSNALYIFNEIPQ